jgi:hypothetical protein
MATKTADRLDVPVLGDDDLCHISIGGDDPTVVYCGAKVNEGFCCGTPETRCGRPPCPECAMLYEQTNGRPARRVMR